MHDPELPDGKERGRRLAVLMEAHPDAFRNKTALTLLRFCPQDVVCVIDPGRGDGSMLEGVVKDIPVVSTALDAVKLGAKALVIGVATPGGYLPTELRPTVYDAIRLRLSIISGLHESAAGDPNMASLAARHAVELVNLRKVPDDEMVVGTGKARGTEAFRVLVVGTDASIGKTTTLLMLERWLRRRGDGLKTRWVATGQDGILVKGRGVCIDRCIADFASGAVERLVLHEAKGADLLLVEGQDAILSPCYSAVALSLLHGSCPDAMVLCHQPTRTKHRHSDVPIPSLQHYRQLYEAMLAPLHPGRVVAISLNTIGLDDGQAARAVAEATAATGLPAADLVREGEAGVARIAEAIIAARAKRRGGRSGRGAARPKKAKARTAR